jgi:TRAP-type C4-dicarboxylate transport system permease small subunit
MENSTIIILVIALIGAILGWKQVTQMLGPTNMSPGQPAFNAVASAFKIAIKIVLAVVLGYIFFIINIIKKIIDHANAKKTDTDNT